MNSIEGRADCEQIHKERYENERLIGDGKRVRRKINSVGKGADYG